MKSHAQGLYPTRIGSSQQIPCFAWHASVLAACLIPALLVGLHGLNRPYDAIPDQDLLWASEALRLMRGVAPSYADHPGAIWSLIYKLNISLAQALGSQNSLDSSGNILPQGIETAIKLARVENAFIAGICAYSVYPTGLSLRVRKPIAAAAAATCGLSSAILVGVSEIRHETISVLFLLLSTLSFAYGCSQLPGTARRSISTLISIACIALAAFSKNQSLLLFPLVILADLRIANNGKKLLADAPSPTRTQLNRRTCATLALASCLPWLISAYPDIDLINLPFWIVINSGLSLILSLGTSNQATTRTLQRCLFWIGAAEIIVFRLISPQWWRQGVTGFPSWMFRYANTATESQPNITAQLSTGINHYLHALFEAPTLALLALALAAILSIANLYRALARKNTIISDSKHSSGLSAAWMLCCLSLASSSMRIEDRYEIYILIPLLLTASAQIELGLSSRPQLRKFSWETILGLCAGLVLLTASLRSLSNLPQLERFINQGQSRDVLCIGHHMDRTMQFTSAGQCKVFPKGAMDKNIYDSWWGPR